jgi:hypothetical protein
LRHGEDCLCGSSCAFPGCDERPRIRLKFHQPVGPSLRTVHAGMTIDFCSDEHVKGWTAILAGVPVSAVSFDLVR